MERDSVVTDHNNPLSRGPGGLLRSSKSRKNGTASVETTDHPSGHVMRTKRMGRALAGVEGANPLSRGPSGLLRSSKSGKHRRTAAVGNLQLTTIAAE